MRRVIHHRISAIQITSVEMTWTDEDESAVDLASPLPAPTQTGEANPSVPTLPAGPARRRKRVSATSHNENKSFIAIETQSIVEK